MSGGTQGSGDGRRAARYAVHTLDGDDAGTIELLEEPQPGDFITLPGDRWMRVHSVIARERIAEFTDGRGVAWLQVEFSDGQPHIEPP